MKTGSDVPAVSHQLMYFQIKQWRSQQGYTGQWVNWNNKREQWDLVYCHRLFVVLVSHSILLSLSALCLCTHL